MAPAVRRCVQRSWDAPSSGAKPSPERPSGPRGSVFKLGIPMAVRREVVQTRREPGTRRREGTEASSVHYVEGLSGEPVRRSSVSTTAAGARWECRA